MSTNLTDDERRDIDAMGFAADGGILTRGRLSLLKLGASWVACYNAEERGDNPRNALRALARSQTGDTKRFIMDAADDGGAPSCVSELEIHTAVGGEPVALTGDDAERALARLIGGV